MLQCEILIILYSVCVFATPLYDESTTYDLGLDGWKGKWFPHQPGRYIKDDNPIVEYNPKYTDDKSYDNNHGIVMGVKNPSCDDGQTKLSTDWNFSPINYTCYDDRNIYLPIESISPILECEHVPKRYSAQHMCMDESINYEKPIPTYGPHRPLWPKYGEYQFVPKQRWLHNLEHGAIVMLYHPCANVYEVNILKRLVRGCLYRHVISPNDQLDSKRPLALISWGCSLTMSKVDTNVVTAFITEYALRGPEKNSKNGQYDKELLHPAEIVSNVDDDNLCPGKNM